jgi:ribosomal protein L32
MNVVASDTIPWPGGASARTAQRAAIDAQLISSRVRQNSRRASGKALSASYSVNIDRPCGEGRSGYACRHHAGSAPAGH